MKTDNENKVIQTTWCPRCDATKGSPCKSVRMHRKMGICPPHSERLDQYRRRQEKAFAIASARN